MAAENLVLQNQTIFLQIRNNIYAQIRRLQWIAKEIFLLTELLTPKKYVSLLQQDVFEYHNITANCYAIVTTRQRNTDITKGKLPKLLAKSEVI